MAKAATDVKTKGDKTASEDSSTQKEDEKKKGTATETVEEEQETESTTEDEQTTEETSEEESSEETADSETTSDSEDESTAKDKKHEKSVPYERFQEVNARLKAAEEKLSQLDGRTKEKTWDDLSFPELRAALKYYRDEKNEKMMEFLEDKIVEKKAAEIIDGREKKREFGEIRARAWSEVIAKYPDLKNPKSDHFLRTKELIESDPRYAKEPEGYAVAAKVVAADLLEDQLRKTKKKSVAGKHEADTKLRRDGLETGSRPGTGAGNASLEKLEQAAVASGSPYSAEWRRYMRAASKAKKE